MDITPAVPEGASLIESYGTRGFRIKGTLYQGAILVCADSVWSLAAQILPDLTADDFSPLRDLDEPPTLLLLGTGASQRFAPIELRAALRAQNMTLESMTSAAACRTYNVLLAEGRRVAAALLPL